MPRQLTNTLHKTEDSTQQIRTNSLGKEYRSEQTVPGSLFVERENEGESGRNADQLNVPLKQAEDYMNCYSSINLIFCLDVKKLIFPVWLNLNLSVIVFFFIRTYIFLFWLLLAFV